MQKWFVAEGNKKTGPFAPEQLKEMVRTGRLKPDSQVLLEGSQKWTAASSVKGLFPTRVPGKPGTPDASGSGSPPATAAAPRKRFWTWPRKLGLIVFLATAATGAWFYWEAETLKQQMQEQADESRDAVTKYRSVKDDLEQSNSQVKALENKAEEQHKEIEALKQSILELQKQTEAEKAVNEKLKLRLKDIESSKGPYFTLDRYALATPAEAESSLPDLVTHLVKPTFNDKEKFRTLFRWLTDRIAYDTKGKKGGDSDAEGSFKNRQGDGGGYATLLKKMGELAGLHVEVVNGHGKGLGQSPWADVDDGNHAWNAVKLDGQWRLLDASWCAGYISKNAYVKRPDETFFLTDPEEFILTHFPHDEKWQLLDRPLTKKAGDKLIQCQIHPFLLKAGFKLSHFLKALDETAFPAFVAVENDPKVNLLIRQAPVLKTLGTGQNVLLRFESADLAAMAVQNGGKWAELDKRGPFFAGDFQPAEGVLAVGVKKTPADAEYTRVFRYVVEPGQPRPKAAFEPDDRKYAIVWHESLDVAMKRAQDFARPVFVLTGRDLPATSAALKTLPIASLVQRHFVALHLNPNNISAKIRPHFTEAAKSSKGNTPPFLVFLSAKGEYLHGSTGVKDPEEFLQELRLALARDGVAMAKDKVPELMHGLSALEKALADKKPAEAGKIYKQILQLPGHHPSKDDVYGLLESAQKEGLSRLQQAFEAAEKGDHAAAQEALTKIKDDYAEWPVSGEVDTHLRALKALKAIHDIIAGERSWTVRAQEYLDHLELDLPDTPITGMAQRAKQKVKG